MTTAGADAASETTALVVTAVPSTPPPAAPAVGPDLTVVDQQLAELDKALDDFDQMTATTEGDPSR